MGTMGGLRVLDGKRDEPVAILTRYKPEPAAGRCLVYEVGTNPPVPRCDREVRLRDRPRG